MSLKNGTTKQCVHCGKSFYVAKTHSNAKYCSRKCYTDYRWGESHIKTRICKYCGAKFDKFASDENVCCSKRCSRLYRSIVNQGEKSRFWRGGKMAPYHKEWRTYRRLALERDNYKCAFCDSTKNISVHHINPYRYSRNHNLDNLVTLCRRCHSKEEYRVNKATAEAMEYGRLVRRYRLAGLEPPPR